MSSTPAAAPYPAIGPAELVFGLTYGSGADTDLFQSLLGDQLQHYGYELRPVRLSDYFASILGKDGFSRNRPDATRKLQDFGDELCERADEPSVLAQLASYLIAVQRSAEAETERTVWLVRSFKRIEEIAAMRRVYGPRFLLFSLYAPEELRLQRAEEHWKRWSTSTSKRYMDEVTRDLRRDDSDSAATYGQAVRATFALGDFFIDGRDEEHLSASLPRAVRILFGEPFVSPERDEQAMYHAYTAGLRSAEMGRQVGAAITDASGTVLTVGTNDVPKAGGGLYWAGDDEDARDGAESPAIDSNTQWQRRISRELLVRMVEKKWLRPSRMNELSPGAWDVDDEHLDEFLRDVKSTRFSSLTEFGRAVHAEMDAITTAARKGVPLANAQLVCTTYPCHNCTRHIIASGINRVVYVYPYSKSLATELHADALVVEPIKGGPMPGRVVFEQYIGVAPRLYPQAFHFEPDDRKNDRGAGMRILDPKNQIPRMLQPHSTFSFGGPAFPNERTVTLESEAVTTFTAVVRKKRLRLPAPISQEINS